MGQRGSLLARVSSPPPTADFNPLGELHSTERVKHLFACHGRVPKLLADFLHMVINKVLAVLRRPDVTPEHPEAFGDIRNRAINGQTRIVMWQLPPVKYELVCYTHNQAAVAVADATDNETFEMPVLSPEFLLYFMKKGRSVAGVRIPTADNLVSFLFRQPLPFTQGRRCLAFPFGGIVAPDA